VHAAFEDLNILEKLFLEAKERLLGVELAKAPATIAILRGS
jgi:hypothetical protein